jgi:hypothetical protein
VGRQQPVMQKYPAAQSGWPGRPHAGAPAGQVWTLQSGGSVSFPTQSSQWSHGFKQAATCSHGLHFVGSVSVLRLQLPVPGGFSEPSQTVVGAPGIEQHPKQSHPFGVSGPQ